MEEENIKTIIPAKCPHCNNDIFISYAFSPPALSNVLSNDLIKQAKKEVREKIVDSFLSDEEKQKVIETINDPGTLFGPEDVESVLGQFLN